MNDAAPAWKRFWENLKRRQVFRATAIYAVAAWGLVQVADVVLPVFGDKGAVMRAIVVIAFAGFPVAVILAWVFDVSSEGITITDSEGGGTSPSRRRRRWLRPLIAAPLLAGVVGGAVWYFTRAADEPEFVRQARPDEMPIVAVLPLENLTGRKEHDWAGGGIASLIRDGLAQSKYMAVVSAARTMRLTADTTNIDEIFTRAVDSGISHVLTGEILRTPQGLTVTSRLTDLRRNVEVGANRQESLDPEELVGVATPVTSLVKQGLGVPGTEKVDVFAADYATRNVTAYQAFVVGMQHFLAYDYASARQMFEAAVERAPDFAMARYRLAHTDAALGDTDAALRQVRLARQDAARLSAREQQYIAAGESYFSRNNAEAEKLYRALLESWPYETEARVLLLYVLWAEGRFEEALVQAEALVAQDPGDEVGWSSMADLNLRLARYDDAERAVQKFIELAPDNPNAHYLLGETQLFRGQFSLAATEYEKALALDAAFGDAGLKLAHVDVLEGRTPAAITRLQAMVASTALPASLRISAATDAAHLLRAEGRCAEAERMLVELAPELETEKITVAYALGIRARCRLDAGDLAGAMELAQQAVERSPGRPTRYVLIRGLVEVAAGDLEAADRTVAALRALQPPPAADDPTDRAAADYLAGLRALKSGDAAAAVGLLNDAIAAGGTRYDVYEVALARALAATGDARAARAAARTASDRGPPGSLRLEFEPGRREAARLLREWGG
jgi:adenylate cyclase